MSEEHAPKQVPFWRQPSELENRWFVVVMLLVAIALPNGLDSRYVLISWRWLVPALELGLLVVLLAFDFTMPGRQRHPVARRVSLVLLAMLTVGNAVNAVLLDRSIIRGQHVSAATLLAGAVIIWVTNMIVFAQLYWELDAGGPGARAEGGHYPDFLFPQMDVTSAAPPQWRPTYGDYLYTSLTNATAFSPTDTMPLTARAKAAMGAQSIVALVTMGLVVARAVNIL